MYYSWVRHILLFQILHKAARLKSEAETPRALYPDYRYTGPLRAYSKSPRRAVPEHISRPDYADHPEGISWEERDAKRSR